MTPPWAHVWTEAAHRPTPSVRPVEVATALVFALLAMVLRWTPPHIRDARASQNSAIPRADWASGDRAPTFRQLLGAALAGCAVGLFIGGQGGVLAGLASTIGVLVFSARRVSASEQRARLRLVAAAPPVIDLFAAGLAAGLLPADAAEVAAEAFGASSVRALEREARDRKAAERTTSLRRRLLRLYPERLSAGRPQATNPSVEIAERFAVAARSLRRGVDPETAWRPLAVDSATLPVAAAALRTSRTGAPASETVARAARDLWSGAERAAQAQIHSVAVRVAVPLALCFLPAFVLIGIAPTVLGILVELRP